MSQEDNIIKQADNIRKGYTSVLEDEQEETLSFLDELNKLVRLILGDDSTDIYILLTPEELANWKRQKAKRIIVKFLRSIKMKYILYFTLLATITGFLVHEALPFYAIDGIISTKTWLKAMLTEVSFIFLSSYRSSSKVQILGVGTLRVAIFCLMLFVITNEVTMTGTENIAKIDNLQSRIQRLELQIEKTEKDIKRYREINWPRNMTQSIRKREQLENQLQTLKQRQEQEGASKELSDLIRYKMYGKAAFRLILMFISVLISRRVFKF
jgi:outer membrane murein-binding lipoprotein Lpp